MRANRDDASAGALGRRHASSPVGVGKPGHHVVLLLPLEVHDQPGSSCEVPSNLRQPDKVRRPRYRHMAGGLLGGVLDVNSIGGDVVQPRRDRSVAGSFCSFKGRILDVALPVIGRQEIPSVVDAVDVHRIVDVVIIGVSYLDNLPGTLLNLNSVLSRFRYGPLAFSVFVLFISGPACLISTGDATSGRPARAVQLESCRPGP